VSFSSRRGSHFETNAAARIQNYRTGPGAPAKLDRKLLIRLVRSERFELPTCWFEAMNAPRISNLAVGTLVALDS
jgi:hypothetical protein